MLYLQQLEADLHDSFGQYDDLLKVAGDYARDAAYLRQDVAAMIFPRAFNPPSEALIADISNKFSRLVEDIELLVMPNKDSSSSSLSAFLQSGFHRDPALLEFLLARHSEQQLEMRLAAKSDVPLSDTLPARLLLHGDHNIAEAAQTLLASSSLNRRGAALDWSALPPELIHGICWRIISAQKPQATEGIRQKVQHLLSGYDEGRTSAAAALKLLHLLGPKQQDFLQQAEESGVALFVANLARKTLLRHDQVLRLIDLPSISPFTVIQRAAEIGPDNAMKNIRVFFAFDRLSPQDISLFERGFESLTPDDAGAAILAWQSDHAVFGGVA